MLKLALNKSMQASVDKQSINKLWPEYPFKKLNA